MSLEEKRMNELIALINKYNRDYYVLDNPVISDDEWDKLYFELLKLEKLTGIVLKNSPTKQVADKKLLDGFTKHKHISRLYSLNKVTEKEALSKWVNEVKEKHSEAEFIVEYKFDGLTQCLTYKNGKFISAATRGNGEIGEDVTEQVKNISGIPSKINNAGTLEIGGEGIIRRSTLQKLNESGEEYFKSERNAVAGTIRNLDPMMTKKRNVEIFFYFIHGKDAPKSYTECQDFFKTNGFNVDNFFKVCKSYEEIIEAVDLIEKEKENLDVLIDGAVIKINQNYIREELGYTDKFPRGEIAYKFPAMEVTTLLRDVVWQVGRSGKITPIGMLDEVFLAGATIKRATLNNSGDIARKKVKLNSRVLVRRSNEVIPEILGISEDLPGSKEIEIPTVCPNCHEPLVEIGANLFCKNSDCSHRVIDSLIHFCSKAGFNIEGIRDKTAEALYDILGINTPDKLFNLSYDELVKICLIEDTSKVKTSKKAENILKEIEKSKVINFSNFIFSLGINGVGTKASKVISKSFTTLDLLKSAEVDELTSINDIGQITALDIVNWFNDAKNIELIENLLNKGVNIIYEANTKVFNDNFKDKTFVITGSFDELSRDEISKIIEDFGGKTSTSVSKKTDYVIVGENAGSKFDKAKELGVKTLDLDEFKKMF